MALRGLLYGIARTGQIRSALNVMRMRKIEMVSSEVKEREGHLDCAARNGEKVKDVGTTKAVEASVGDP